jgi:type I restriction enzyme S subunit
MSTGTPEITNNARTRLGVLAHVEMGQAPSSAFVKNDAVGLPFLQGNAEFGATTPHHASYCARPLKVCQVGDILISVRAPVRLIRLTANIASAEDLRPYDSRRSFQNSDGI